MPDYKRFWKPSYSPTAVRENDRDKISASEFGLIDFDSLLKAPDLSGIAFEMTESLLGDDDIMKRDILDRFIDYVYFRVQTGEYEISSPIFPIRRMRNPELEKKVIELLNVHLYPEIVFRLLKFFTRNIHDSDTNIFIANLIYSEDIIRAIYEAFMLVGKDIFILDQDKRALNVKRIQQFSPHSDNRLSSPLDAAVRLRYILEFFASKYNVSHIYSVDDLSMQLLIDRMNAESQQP